MGCSCSSIVRIGGKGANGARGTEDGLGDGYVSCSHRGAETGGRGGGGRGREVPPAKLEADKSPEAEKEDSWCVDQWIYPAVGLTSSNRRTSSFLQQKGKQAVHAG